LAASASASVGSATVLHDNGPNLRSACQAGAGTMYIPAGGFYPFNSILDLSTCNYSKILVGSPLTVNDPWLIPAPLTVEGLPVGGCFPSSKVDYCAQIAGNGYPLFLMTPGTAGSNVFRNLFLRCFQNYQSCVFYDQDHNGNNVSQQNFVHMNFAGCSSL